MGEAEVVGEDDRLDAVAGSHLRQYAADMGLHRGLRHHQALGDLTVAPALADGDEDLVLPFGQGAYRGSSAAL